jgi:hypothetical protein
MSAGPNKDEARDVTAPDAVPAQPVTVTPIPAEPVSTGMAADASGGSLADLGDDRIGHAFDQTNGLVDTEGESDETAEGEQDSAGERREEDNRPGGLPPVGGGLGQH